MTYRSTEDSLRAEVERLQREVATMRPTPRRYAWLPGDYLAAPVIIGGYPLGIVLTGLGIETGSATGLGVALALGGCVVGARAPVGVQGAAVSRRARLIRAVGRLLRATEGGDRPPSWAVEASLRGVRGGALDVRGWRRWTVAHRRWRAAGVALPSDDAGGAP